MLSYILEVSLCWGAFYVLYWLLLSKETFFHFNRWYLVSTLLASLVIPAVEWELPAAQTEIATVYFQPITVGVETLEVTVTATAITAGIGFLDVLTWIYWAGMAFCMLRFLVGMRQIYRLYRRSEKRYRNGYEIVLSEKIHPPFSFFNSLFISKSVELAPDDRQAIMRHELAHIRGGHSIDVLLLEILNAIFWCSPFIYLYRRSLRNVHEYIADAAVLRTTQRKQYGHLLIRQSQSGPAIAIANHFHSQLKKRILMMMRNQSKRQAMLKYLLVIPLTLLVLLIFSNAEAKASLQQQAEEVKQVIENQLDVNISENIVTKVSGETFTKFEVVDGEIRFEAKEGVSIEMDTIPIITNSKSSDDKMIHFEIYYANGEVEKLLSKANESTINDKVNPADIESIEVFRDNGENLIKIWMKGSFKNKMNPNIEIHYSDGKTERTNDQQKVNQLIALDLVQSVEVNKAENLVEVNVSKPKHLIPPVDPNWLDKTSIQIGGDNTILFQHEANGVPVNGKISSVTYELQEPALYPGCEGEKELTKRKECSDNYLMTYVAKNIKYPKEAREQNVEGQVIVNFQISESGKVHSPKIIKGIGKSCDEEVLRIVNQMPSWTPAKKDGKSVASEFILPVKFAINTDQTKEQPKVEEVVVIGQKVEETTNPSQPEVFKVVEEMPRFPGCEDEAAEEVEKKACADKRMLEFIYKNLKYPKEAREKNIEGMAVVSFIVGKDGVVRKPKAVRSIGGGCDEEIIRLVNMMPQWIPGRQKGRAVDVQFNLPIRFKLDHSVNKEEGSFPSPPRPPMTEIPANTLQLQNFKASPNPSNGIVNLSFKGEKKPTLIKVFDLQGKELQSLNLNNFDGTFNEQLDLSKAPKGTLIISVIQGEKVYTEKIIVQ